MSMKQRNSRYQSITKDADNNNEVFLDLKRFKQLKLILSKEIWLNNVKQLKRRKYQIIDGHNNGTKMFNFSSGL